MAETLGAVLLVFGNSNLSNRADLFKEASNAIFVSTEAKVTTEDSGGRLSTLLMRAITLGSITRELDLENTSIKLSAVNSVECLDCVVMVSVFDESNTLEGEVLAFGKISEAFEDRAEAIFVGVLADTTDEELGLTSILGVDISLSRVVGTSSLTAFRSALFLVGVFVGLSDLEVITSGTITLGV